MKKSPTEPRPGSSAERASRWLLAVAIAGSALAVGSVHTISLCVVAGVVALAAALSWWDAEPTDVRPVATVLLVTGAALTVYTALQCIPMPIAWLNAIAPHNGDVWSRALSPLHRPGDVVRWAPISLDPTATHVEVLKGVTYLLAFVTAIRIARRREGVAFLSAVLVVTGLILAAAALLHPAFGAHRLYGLYEPGPGISERHLAPLMNPNNLAGYLNLALCVALGTTLAPEPRIPRAIPAAIVVVLAPIQVWVASRAGVLTMVLGAILVVAVVRLARSRSRPRRGSVATLALVVVLGAAAVGSAIVLGGSDDASRELLSTDSDKFRLLVHAMRMLPAVPLFGCGRGTFESAYPAFRTDVGLQTFTHPENLVAQWLLEWGLPMGLAGLGAVAFALRPNAVLARSSTAAGAWAGIVAVAVQNLGDLGSEIPGLVLGCTVAVAIVVGGTPGRRPRWSVERWSRAPRALAIVGASAATVTIGVAAAGMTGELHGDERALHDAAFQEHLGATAMHDLDRTAMARHPAEPYLPFVVALRASHEHDDDALPWIEGTLERAPAYAYAHLLLARVVSRRSPSQARLEYRLALQHAPELVWTILAEVPRLVGGYDDAMELIPDDKDAAQMLGSLAVALRERLPATSVRLDEELMSRAPTLSEPIGREAADAVEDLEAGESAPWCLGDARPSCVRRALDAVDRLQGLRPGECAPQVLRARAQIAAGRASTAVADLAKVVDTVNDRVECLQRLEEIAIQTGDEERATEALHKIGNAGCSDDLECVQRLSWAAHEEQLRGNTGRALALYKRAYERASEDDGILETIAGLAVKAGLHGEAARDYERLAQRHPEQTGWMRAAQAERDEALRSTMKL